MDGLFGPEDPYLKALRKLAQKEGLEGMQISLHEGRILEFLTRIFKAKKIVEIGTLYGYSAFCMARALPADGKIWTLDYSVEKQKKAQEVLKNSSIGQKIHCLSGPAQGSLKTITASAPFDMLFIDADKESYLEYLSWAEKHLKKEGLLVADNSFLFGAVYGGASRPLKPKATEVMKEFNLRISSFWKGALIPTSEGLTVGLRP